MDVADPVPSGYKEFAYCGCRTSGFVGVAYMAYNTRMWVGNITHDSVSGTATSIILVKKIH